MRSLFHLTGVDFFYIYIFAIKLRLITAETLNTLPIISSIFDANKSDNTVSNEVNNMNILLNFAKFENCSRYCCKDILIGLTWH